LIFQVVGIAGDVVGSRIEDGAVATIYLPLLRDGDGLPRDSTPLPYVPRGGYYVVRGAPQSASTVRAVVRDLDARVPAIGIQPLSTLAQDATARVRLTLLLLAAAGAAVLFLGVIGVYSVVSYAAAGRLREFGVRLTFGATPALIASMILNEGLALAGAGIAAGVLVAAIGTGFMRSLLFGVTPLSIPEFAAAAILLGGVTLLAAAGPARRAARTDPAVVLRGE
jgi:ABC-type lipoprotein release transport system permease subunit